MLTKRIYLRINLILKSPLCVSNGGEDNTDKDVILDFNGNPFVPATSLCGGMRAYLADDIQNQVFGYIDTENDENENKQKSMISPVTIYDLEFDETPKISVRDGVGLDDDKIAKQNAKFEYEIIETGAKASFRMELKIYDNEETIISSIKNILFAIDNGDIRFGHKKNRGLGQFKISKILVKEFTKDSIEKWYNFDWNNMNDCTDEWLVGTLEEDIFRINIPLKLKGGISIRQYSAKLNEPDYSHITCNGDPIIPGTSWAGAILHRANDLLKELVPQINDSKEMLNEVFGYVNENTKEAKQSDIIINESILENSKCIETTRTSINRFDESTIEKALYTEKTFVGGNTNLVITIKNKSKNLWAIGLIYLVIEDIKNGFLSIGGLASIGRGIFELNGPLEDYSCYLQALAQKIKKNMDKSSKG